MKKLLIIMAIPLLFITGCGVAKLDNGKDAVVSLNNGKISVDELYEKMKNEYALNVLIDMVDTKILEELYPTTEDETTYIEGKVTEVQYYQQIYADQFPTVDQFIQGYYGLRDLNAYKEYVKLSYKRTQAVEDYSKKLVTEKEIDNYYKDKAVGDITAKHILIKVTVDGSATDDEKTKADSEALKKAKNIIAELKAGKKFEDLAKEHSDDGSAANGGELDPFNRGDMVKEFEEAAIALKKGEYSSEPVKTEFGYHIILKVDQKEKPKLDDIKKKIIEVLAEDKLANDADTSNKALIQLRKDHGLKVEDSELNKQYKNFMDKY